MFLSRFSILSLALVSTLTLNSLCHAMRSEEGSEKEDQANSSSTSGNRKPEPGSPEWQKENSTFFALAMKKLLSNPEKSKELLHAGDENHYPFATQELAKWAYLKGEIDEAQALFDLACDNLIKYYDALDDQMRVLYAENISKFGKKSEELKNIFAKYKDNKIFEAFLGEKKPTPTHENSDELRNLHNTFGDTERDKLFTPSSSDDSELPVMERPSQDSGSSSNSSSGNGILPAKPSRSEEFGKLVITKLAELKLGNTGNCEDDVDWDAPFDDKEDGVAKSGEPRLENDENDLNDDAFDATDDEEEI